MAYTDAIRTWVDALRSGRYEQGRDRLVTTDAVGDRRYCCLGVACDISSLGRWDDVEGYVIDTDGETYSDPGELPQPVRKWLGIDQSDPVYDDVAIGGAPRHDVTLIQLNDDHDWTFAQIADLLEERHLTPATTTSTTQGD